MAAVDRVAAMAEAPRQEAVVVRRRPARSNNSRSV
jgi:hypothetical protein